MILARYTVYPLPGNTEYRKAGSALACIFVDCNDKEEALAKAEAYLDSEYWKIEELERVDHLRSDADQHP